jgi:hypothetical protein
VLKEAGSFLDRRLCLAGLRVERELDGKDRMAIVAAASGNSDPKTGI